MQMFVSIQLLIIFFLFVLLFVGTVILLTRSHISTLKQMNQIQVRSLQRLNRRLANQNTDLLNRLQSEDLRTYHSLSSQAPDSQDYKVISKTDAAEIEQLKEFSAGLGEAIYDDDTGPADSEFEDTLREFGINFSGHEG